MDSDSCMYDVIIIGGGCAGSSTALSLMQHGVNNIAIIEKGNYSNLRVGETIQPPTSELLKQLGVWESFLKDTHLPSSGVASAWGTSQIAYSDFIFKVQGKGWHLNRNVFDKRMLNFAAEKGATIFSNTRFKKARRDKDRWGIECDSLNLKAKFIVDASGRNSAFAKQQGSNKILFDDLHGIYTYWRQPKDALKKFGTSHTLVESVENGWWYSALLPNNVLAVAFMTDTLEIKTQELKKTAMYLKQLKKSTHTGKRICDHELQSTPSIKVAASFELDNIVGDAWLSVGDSASAYDPLSSYGIQKALQNGIKAGATIKTALSGDFSVLKKYEENIKQEFENFLTMRFTYYGMETRWSEHPFWKSRQHIINIHPKQELILNPNKQVHSRRWNRILPEEDLDILTASCQQVKTAETLVKEFQEKSNHKYPDWRVIHAVNFLHEMEVIG